MAKIVPAILAKTEKEFITKLRRLEVFFDLIQIDCMDGKFVMNKTFYDLKRINKLKTKANFELHLMVNDPMKVIKSFVGNKRVKRYIVHVESFKDKDQINDIIKLVLRQKKELFLAVNPSTELDVISNFSDKIDGILIMGVEPGWSNHKIKKSIKQKIKKTRKLFPKLLIAVDGGVNEKNYVSIIKAGVVL